MSDKTDRKEELLNIKNDQNHHRTVSLSGLDDPELSRRRCSFYSATGSGNSPGRDGRGSVFSDVDSDNETVTMAKMNNHRQRVFSDNLCTKHHHRRSSIAVKFRNTFGDSTQLREPQSVFLDRRDSNASTASTASNSTASQPSTPASMPTSPVRESFKRPPTPIAERILKGELDL